MDFTKTNCDGCSQPFTKEDDIVVCPVCGTPQHRHCYESAGGCVNAGKHELGFEYQPPEAVFDESEGVDSKEEDKRTRRDQISEELNARINSSLQEGELPEVDDVIEQRVAAVCPGITPEQREEQVCGADIGLTASFIGNNAPRYVDKFRRFERTKRSTFNWAAFLLSPYWFFWRKLYKPGILLAAVDISFTILVTFFVQPIIPFYEIIVSGAIDSLAEDDFLLIQSVGLKLMFIYVAAFIIHLLAGVFADRMYYNYCKKSLHEYRFIRGTEENENALKYYLSKSSTSFLATLISIIAIQGLPNLLLSFIIK